MSICLSHYSTSPSGKRSDLRLIVGADLAYPPEKVVHGHVLLSPVAS